MRSASHGLEIRGPRKVVDFVGRGGARERAQFSPSAETETSGLCDDEVQPSFFTYSVQSWQLTSLGVYLNVLIYMGASFWA